MTQKPIKWLGEYTYKTPKGLYDVLHTTPVTRVIRRYRDWGPKTFFSNYMYWFRVNVVRFAMWAMRLEIDAGPLIDDSRDDFGTETPIEIAPDELVDDPRVFTIAENWVWRIFENLDLRDVIRDKNEGK